MKKIYTMLAAALAVGVSANAQGLTPTEVTFNNPSFEEQDATIIAGANLVGWEIAGGNAVTTDADGNEVTTNLYAFQNRNKSWTDGNYGMRSAANVDIDGGNYVWQAVLGQKPGTYVLQLDGEITRNGWKGGEWQADQKGFAFIVDNYGDPENEGTPEEPAEGATFFYVGDQSKGDTWQILYRYYVVHTTDAATFEDGETDIKFGFGYPTSSAPITKARFCFDNFHLYFFDTNDTEAVKKYVDETLIGDIKTVDDSGNAVYKVVNPAGNVEQTLAGVVGNTPATLGVSDVTVAPATLEGNNKYYNLQGIEVADPTQPGLYIHNGKKILVK